MSPARLQFNSDKSQGDERLSKSDKKWPRPGDILIHKFRHQPGKVVAEVLIVDQSSGRISVKVDGVVFGSLSAAAKSISGHATNGWIFWGLKSQKPSAQIHSSSR